MDDPRLMERLLEFANGDQELADQWAAMLGDEPFVPLADELEAAENIPEIDAAAFASDESTTLPDGSEISDTFESFSSTASEAELSEQELPSMIEGLYSQSMEATTQGAQEMFAEGSLETSIEGIDASILELEAEIEALVGEEAAIAAEIEALEGAVAASEAAVGEAVAVEAVAAEEVVAAVAAEGAAVAAEAADWWTIIGGIITAGAIAAAAAAVIIAKQKHDEAQRKKKEEEDNLKKHEDDLHDKRYSQSVIPAKRESKKKRKENLQQKRSEKSSELEKSKNKIKAYKMIHKAINLKLWFIKYWMATKNKKLSRPLDIPTPRSPAKSQIHTVKEGDEHQTIKVIRARDQSEKTFKNNEYLQRYGGGNKVAVVWEHVNKPSNKLKSLETVKIWASNNGVSDERHSQCGLWGVIGENAYEIGLEAVGRKPELYTFYENGSHKGGKQFQLDKYDSVFLCVRSAPYPAWAAACHGFEVQYTCYPEVFTVKEGGEHQKIKVIRASDQSEKTFKNKEYLQRYGGGNKVAVVWEHVNKPSNKLKSLETVKIWASNNGVSDERHSQCGLWGAIGENAYEIGLEAVGRKPELYTFYENGSHKGGKQFQLDKYDSVFLCVRSAPYPAWAAACHGFEVQYTCYP